MVMTNIFAYRSTDPRKMLCAEDPIGPDNDFHITGESTKAGLTVAGWGNHGNRLGRGNHVLSLLKDPHYLTLTNNGSPGHPLYLAKWLKPKPY